jgi:uncharacterized protein YerC
MQKAPNALSKNDETQLKFELAQIIADLKTPRQILSFLTLFMSDAELLILAKRLAIFKRLNQNYSYEAIQKELNVSSATVSAVAQLKNDPFADTIAEHSTAQDWAQTTADRIRGFFGSKKN